MTVNHSISPNATMTRFSPAKINLFLHIVGRRDDGYHNLQTVFRLLDWGDYLHFLPTHLVDVSSVLAQKTTAESKVRALCKKLITLTGASTVTAEIMDNLIIKAAIALLNKAWTTNLLPTHLQAITITLDKRLPTGAGLGGGSSNAATTLLALNELWQLMFSHAQLLLIGQTLGADIPIFIFGQDAIAMGIGEQLTPIYLPDQQYLLLTPNVHIHTAELFAHTDLRRDINTLSIDTIRNHYKQYRQQLLPPYHNVFTSVVTNLAPAVDEALQYLQNLEQHAAGSARMTGSGSAVFLPLDQSVSNKTNQLASWIKHAPCPAYLVNNLRQ